MTLYRSLVVMLLLSTGAYAGQGEGARLFTAATPALLDERCQQEECMVIYWSLDCPPCHSELKTLGDVLKGREAPGMVLVSVDGRAQLAEIGETLSRYRVAQLESWITPSPLDLPLRYAIDPKWFGELPNSYLYTAGSRKVRIVGEIEASRLQMIVSRFARQAKN
ncbi:MAG: hypothetical protein OEZ16_07410 [Chromatiales bacterium]|nr:hypothetical protein [Chromatiales bacterium]